jgi:class 3 adenylate cyclase
MAEATTRNLTILLTDIKDFTPKTSRKTRADILKMLEKHKEIVLPVLEGRGGRLVKTIGDAFLVVFESPTDAVLAGVAVQDALREHNADKQGDDRIDVRIAMNLGEVTLADNDVFGEAVNITARIEGIAEAGEVFFTEAVYLAMNKKEVPSSEIGLFQLKGVPERVRVYKVVREQPVGGATEEAKGLLSFLKPKPTMQESGMTPAKAPWLRRGAAVGIDLLFCTMLVGAFFPKDEHQVRVRYRPQDRAQEKAVEGAVEKAIGDAIRKGGPIVLDKNGLRVGDKIRVDEKGVRIGDAIKIDEHGLRLAAPKAPAMPETPKPPAVTEEEPASSEVQEISKERRKPAFAVLWLVYSTFFLILWSATPGKKILKLKVAAMDGRALDWKAAFVRTLFTFVSASALFLGYLWALWERDRRTWHDLIAGTRVTRA